MRPNEVVDGLRDLQYRCNNDPYFARVINGATNIDTKRNPDGSPNMKLIEDSGEAPDVARLLGHVAADCMQVTSNMVDVLQRAAGLLEGNDVMRIDHAYFGRGFVQFEKPIMVPDIRGETLHIQWVMWVIINGAAMVWGFSDTTHADDHGRDLFERMIEAGEMRPEQADSARRSLGRWMYTGVAMIEDGENLDSHITSPYLFGRVMMALWMLAEQPVTWVSSAPLDRAAAKRARRADLPTDVTVVTLRRPDVIKVDGDEFKTDVNWQHKWVVRGHWAWRVCSATHEFAEPYPDDTNRFRCRVWISSYTKNEDTDLPYTMGDKVAVLAR